MEQILSTVERTAHLTAVCVERVLREHSVSRSEGHVLAHVARHGPTPIAELQRRFGAKRSTLTNVLDRLERRGLIRRELNPADRRSFLIHVTSDGRPTADRVRELLDAIEREVRAAVTERDLRGLEAVAAAVAAIRS